VSQDFTPAFPNWNGLPPRSIVPFWVDANFRTCTDCSIDVVWNVKNSVIQLLKDELNITADPQRTFVISWRNAPSFTLSYLVRII